MTKKVLVLLTLLFCGFIACSQDIKSRWVDSVFLELNLHEKMGQLFMIPISAYADEEELSSLNSKIKEFHPGGILLTGGGPVTSATLINRIQNISNVPMLIGIEAEWGLGQTLDSTISFSPPLLLGALKDDDLVYRMGAEIGRQMNTLGLQINFAPHGDIHYLDDHFLKFYSDNKLRVAKKSLSLMKGLQDQNIIAVANHFSYTNDSVKISEYDIESSFISVQNIDTIESFPYEQLIRNGIRGIHTSYLHFSSADKKTKLPPSLSRLFISEVLKAKLDFKGITFSEIPFLQSFAKKPRPGETEKLTFQLGNDFLIEPLHLGPATRKIVKAAKRDKNLMRQLDESVRRILAAKYEAGFYDYHPIDTDNLFRKLNAPSSQLLKQRIAENATTLVQDKGLLLPVKILEDKKFLSLVIGDDGQNEFNKYLSKYAAFDFLSIQSLQDTVGLRSRLHNYDLIVVSLFPLTENLHSEISKSLHGLANENRIVLCFFSNPKDLIHYKNYPTILMGYYSSPLIQKVTAQIIFGALPANGVLPITLSEEFKEGMSSPGHKLDRLGYSIPEDVGMDSRVLSQIKSITWEAIDQGATPGCHVLVAKNGKVIYNQSMGWFTYDNMQAVTDQTIYDLASVTKVSATLQTVMFMYDWGLIDIEKKISAYLPELQNSNKKDMTIRDILTHQAGLWPFLPFWLQTISEETFLPEYYSDSQSPEYPFPVSENLFARNTMKDSLWQWIINSKVRTKTDRTPFDYRYSDMGFYILQHLAEKILNQPMEDFLSQNIYEPLGAQTVGYLPLNRFEDQQIAPTENDKTFRKSLLTGHVHDQGAAMHGGIAGQAGLFGNATDLAKLGQMWLQRGSYGGFQYFRPQTLDFFTDRQFDPSRRGLGWDKPTVSDWSGPTTLYASPITFGHTGFTGTCIWVDPEFDLLFIFLSNRVYPDMNNTKLLTLNIRPRIQEVIYKSIFSFRQFNNHVETRN